jgi:hypothetical protein
MNYWEPVGVSARSAEDSANERSDRRKITWIISPSHPPTAETPEGSLVMAGRVGVDLAAVEGDNIQTLWMPFSAKCRKFHKRNSAGLR